MSVLTISLALAKDHPEKTKDQAKAQKQTNNSIEKKLDGLILQQEHHQKSIRSLEKGISKQASLQKSFQDDITQQFKSLQKHINNQLTQRADRVKKDQDTFQSEIHNQLQNMKASLILSLSETTQHFDNMMQTNRTNWDNQINEMRHMVQALQDALIAEQSSRYSSLELSGNKLQSEMESIDAQLATLQTHLSQDKPDVQKIINDEITAQKDRFELIETNIKNLISNSNAQLNSDINETIRQLKNDFSRFKQEIDDNLNQMSTQILEIKHEQQIELQSLVKQLTKELNRHDQNIIDSLTKAEHTLDNTHLSWLIYGLLCLILGLIIYIVWDRNTTVAPLIARIRKLEDNLVIEY